MTSSVVVLAAAAAVTHALRTVLVTVVPAHRLPPALRRALAHLAPAALAALVATAVVGHRGLPALVVPGPAHTTHVALVALAVAALIAWRTRNPAPPVLAAVAVASLWEVLS
jgi:branched-subunit amino acid transport protein